MDMKNLSFELGSQVQSDPLLLLWKIRPEGLEDTSNNWNKVSLYNNCLYKSLLSPSSEGTEMSKAISIYRIVLS